MECACIFAPCDVMVRAALAYSPGVLYVLLLADGPDRVIELYLTVLRSRNRSTPLSGVVGERNFLFGV